MIDIPLNYDSEREVPTTLGEFKEILKDSKFENGFNIYGNKIVPISDSLINKVIYGSNIDTQITSVEDLFQNLGKLKNAFVLKSHVGKDVNYTICKDQNYKSLGISGEFLNERTTFVNRVKKRVIDIFDRTVGIKIDEPYIEDPYITKILLSYFKSHNPNISGIIGIKDIGNSFIIDCKIRVGNDEEFSFENTTITLNKNYLTDQIFKDNNKNKKSL